MTRLSKSRIMSSLQCLKRAHLEANRPDLAQYSPATETAFRIGHQVGEMAIALYGGGAGVFVEHGNGLGAALARTRALLGLPDRQPLFEATFEHEGVLVREDLLLPDGDGWRIVEVKASTRRKSEHVQDCAIQAWVHRGAGFRYRRFSLAHIDNRFVYPGGGRFEGLFVEEDLTDEIGQLQHSVPFWVSAARQAAAGEAPPVPVGQHCFSPHECPFFSHCWPTDAPYPVHGLKGSRKKLGELVAAGYRDLREVPPDRLGGEEQSRIWRVTRAGAAEILPAAGRFVRALAYPRHYLDFETVSPAVPLWPGTRPYEVLPFQWSCHIEAAPGELDHAQFLDLSGEPPLRALAESLIRALGESGPVLMYTAYEKGVIAGLAERFPDLAGRLGAIVDRLVDLYPVVKSSYYHPDMFGSWSIKAVSPTVAPELDYADLAGIHEGGEASAAWLEAVRAGTAPDRREEIRRQLLRYCAHDTLAMVRLAEFFSRH